MRVLNISRAAALATRWRVLATCLLLVLAFPSHAAARGVGDAGTRFADIAERYFQDRMNLDPHAASSVLGEARFEDKLLVTIAPTEIARNLASLKRTARELKALDPTQLSERDRLSYDLLREEVQVALDGFAYAGHLMPIDSFGGVSLQVAGYGTGDQIQPLKTVRNYDNYLRRLRRLPAWNAQAIANMREGIATGNVVPKALIEAALPQLKALIEPDFEKSIFSSAIKIMPTTFPKAEQLRLRRAYQQAFARELLPSMRTLVRFLERDYLPKCRDSAGIDALPNGKAYYAYLVRLFTTTTLSPQEIHAIGLAEVQRIRDEMKKIQAHYKFEGTLTEFLQWQDKASIFMPFKTEAEILAAYADINQKVLQQLPRFFGRLPKAALEIRPVPELQRETGSSYYVAALPDGSRPGTFYAWFRDPATLNSSIMTSLFLHEGQPGHHFQAAFAQEMDLPKFRKYGWAPALGEGWALYVETLGHDMGFYNDPNQYLGHLKLELLRAVRLVTDTGLHTMGWSREQTMRYMMDVEGASEAAAKNATERYMAWPGQALAYKIGSREVQSLRDRARARLGGKFSLSEFHDLVLSEGTVPLNILGQIVDRWIAAKEKL